MTEFLGSIFHSMYVLLMGGLGLFFIVGWIRVVIEGFRSYSAVRWMVVSGRMVDHTFTALEAFSKFLQVWWWFIWSAKGQHTFQRGSAYWRDFRDWQYPEPEERYDLDDRGRCVHDTTKKA